MDHIELFVKGLYLSFTAWFLAWGFAKAVNLYKTLTS